MPQMQEPLMFLQAAANVLEIGLISAPFSSKFPDLELFNSLLRA